jgi:ACS family hexuronate transporter-like MFS transporter
MVSRAHRKWWVCALLLFASAVNYMDRQTLANASTRITRELGLVNEQYGNLEFGFGWAFAAGSIFFGIAADRFSVRLVYPVVLLLWSMAGFATGLVKSYEGLLICRTLLGLFEAGHWPCAVKTTRLLLDAKERSMGNSLLQSGTSIGAIVTPLIMRIMMTDAPGSWRWPFLAVGAAGLLWIVFWLSLVRKEDLPVTRDEGATPWRVIFSKRMLVILCVVALINTGWQTIRAWLPKYLQEGRGYSEAEALYFNSVFYVATDIGVIGAGLLTIWFNRRGLSMTRGRFFAFGICAVMSACALLLPQLEKGPFLLVVLLVMGAGALGVFPIYHALTQDLSGAHQGKVTGVAGIAAWAFSPPAQKFFGRLVDRTGSFNEGLVIAGLLPLVALIVLLVFWREPKNPLQT